MNSQVDSVESVEDEAAGKKLAAEFDHAHRELIGTLYYIVGNAEEARDVLQEAFLKCWRNRSSIKEITNLRGWVFRIAVNTARDHRKSAWNRKRQTLPDEVPVVADSMPPEQELMQDEQVRQLRSAVMRLRPEEQEVFLLRQNGEMTYEAIAEAVAIPIGTVKTRMRSALKQLRESLGVTP